MLFIGLYTLIIAMAVMFTAIAIVEVACYDTTEIKTEKRVEKNSLHRSKVGVAYVYVTPKQNKISRHK